MSSKKLKNQKLLRHTILLLFLLWGESGLYAQQASIFNNFKNTLKQANNYFEQGSYQAAVALYMKEAGRSGKELPKDAALNLAYAFSFLGHHAEGVQWFDTVIDAEFNDTINEKFLLQYINSLLAIGRFEEGQHWYTKYLQTAYVNPELHKLTENVKYEDFFKDSIRYKVTALAVNTPFSEFSPISVNDEVYFVSDVPTSQVIRTEYAGVNRSDFNIYQSKKAKNGDLLSPVNIKELNSSLHEGPLAFYNNGKHVLFTRYVFEAGGKGSLRIFRGEREENQWKNIQELPVTIGGSFAHPATNSEGDTIYFVSDAKTGYGGTDVYRVYKIKSGWSTPENLGPEINTKGNEMFPFLHSSGTLYFASNGRLGMGGLDIYAAKIKGGKVVDVTNVGAPINSPFDDFSLYQSFDGSYGYFASNRPGGRGDDDLYKVDFIFMKLRGFVADNTNNKPLEGVEVKLYENNTLVERQLTQKDGAYNFKLYPGRNYTLSFSGSEFRDNMQFVSTFNERKTKIKQLDVQLERKVKMYVLGRAKYGKRQTLSEPQVFVIDKSTGKVDSLTANARGIFNLELDTKNNYTFFVTCDDLAGRLDFSTPEKGKASLSYYVNVPLTKFSTYQVQGIVEGYNPEYLTEIHLTNKLTEKSYTLDISCTGQLNFEAHSYADYELCVSLNGKHQTIYLEKDFTGVIKKVKFNFNNVLNP